MIKALKRVTTGWLVRYLSRKVRRYEPFAISSLDVMAAALQEGDVLLVAGNQQFSTAVKYLTQSTWSHAAMYVGKSEGMENLPEGTPALIEADLRNGVIAVPLGKYASFNTRICRPGEISDSYSASTYTLAASNAGSWQRRSHSRDLLDTNSASVSVNRLPNTSGSGIDSAT